MATSPERFSDPEPEVRLRALLDAMAVEDPAAEPGLVALVAARLEDEHPGIRQAAVDALGRFSALSGVLLDERIARRLVELAQDPSASVRAETAGTLALLGARRVVPGREAALHALLSDTSAKVREEAAAAVGDLKDRTAADALAKLLEDTDLGVRFEAAFALASIGDSRGRPLLEGLLEKNRLRVDAAEGLRRLGDPAAIPALQRCAFRLILRWAERLTLHAVLHTLGDPDAGARVIARVRSWRREERIHALALIGSHGIHAGAPLLLELARDPKSLFRGVALRSLGLLRDEAHAPFFLELAKDEAEPEEVRVEAAEALALLDGAERWMKELARGASPEVMRAAERTRTIQRLG